MTNELVESTTNLNELAALANESLRAMASDMLNHAYRVGEIVNAAKNRVPHGHFLEWVRDNLECSVKTANSCLRIFENWGQLQSRIESGEKLSFRRAIKLLSRRKTSDDESGNAFPLCEEDLEDSSIEDTEFDADDGHLDDVEPDDEDSVHAPMPAPGELLIGLMGEGDDSDIILIEAKPECDRYLRTAKLIGTELTFDKRGVPRDEMLLEHIVHAAEAQSGHEIVWLESREATAANNPLSQFLPEWQYPALAADLVEVA